MQYGYKSVCNKVREYDALSVDHLSAEFIAGGHGRVFVESPCVLHKQRHERAARVARFVLSCHLCDMRSFWVHCCNIVPKFIHRAANKYTPVHTHTPRHTQALAKCCIVSLHNLILEHEGKKAQTHARTHAPACLLPILAQSAGYDGHLKSVCHIASPRPLPALIVCLFPRLLSESH